MAGTAVAARTGFDDGSIREAMAFRVKYRVMFFGQAKKPLRIHELGVHPANRGGLYPNEERCKELCDKILKWGTDPEEANHNGIVVEDFPSAERPKDYEDFLSYNKRQCALKPFLKTCFADSGYCGFGTLSHSHLLIVLRCWLSKANWNLEKGEFLTNFVDKQGRLDLSAVAEKDPAFEKLASEGLTMEVLSWKMMKEEPTAATLISNALNKGQEAALRSSELTALAVLTGEVTRAMEGHLAKHVDYMTIKTKIRHQLDTYVDEPEFIEVFQTVVELGANINTFIAEILEFGSKFVNSKTRQLRMAAFTAINRLPEDCPRIKVALIKRAYRKNPQYGFCPSPESLWARVSCGHHPPAQSVQTGELRGRGKTRGRPGKEGAGAGAGAGRVRD